MRWLLLLALVACKETRQVHLTFGTTARVPIGFRCRDDNGRFLAARAVDRPNAKVKVSLLVDFIGLGGLPSCRQTDIAAFCETHTCTALADPPRFCIPLERPLTGADEAAVLVVGDLVRSLEGTQVTEDAPHDPVIIRAVATAQSCDELAGGAAYDVAKLVGCAVSCPVQLEGVEGDVLLDLPTLSDRCAAGVQACALGEFAVPSTVGQAASGPP